MKRADMRVRRWLQEWNPFCRSVVVEYNVGRLRRPASERAFPYVLRAELYHNDFHRAALTMMHGPRMVLVIRAKSERALRCRAYLCGFSRQLEQTPRLAELTISYRSKRLAHVTP